MRYCLFWDIILQSCQTHSGTITEKKIRGREIFFYKNTGSVKCSNFHGRFSALAGEGQGRQLKNQV